MVRTTDWHSTGRVALTILILSVPALVVHGWLAAAYSSYLGTRLLQDVLFSFGYCTLLGLFVRWQLLGIFSWLVATLAYFAWLLLVMSEGVSYALQEDTFNDRFFAHLDPRNLATGIHGFPILIGGGVLVLLLQLLLSGWLLRYLARLPRTSIVSSRWAKAAVFIAIAVVIAKVDSAPHRLTRYLTHYEDALGFADSPAGRAVFHQITPDPVPRDRLLASSGKNVVMIYMESLERVYTDQKVFPGLTPNLDRLRAQGLDFPNFPTFVGAGYTMAGLFTSQCGAPLFSSPFKVFDPAAGNNNDEATFHPKLVCLGDVLHTAGYKQVYLGGAPINFSNKGLFFQLHGYDEALGLSELEAANGHKLAESGWGLYDSELFGLAAKRYHQLSRSGKPFNLSLLTLDTHPPHGRPSPGCPAYAANGNAVLQAVHCTDYLVGKFITDISSDPAWKNTVVMIMSDHLRMVNEGQYPADYPRHVLFFVVNAGTGVRTSRMYHMDIAPTLLDLLGVRTNADFVAGSDVAKPDSPDSPLVNNEITAAVLRKVLWSLDDKFRLCRKGQLVGWTRNGNFNVGGREMSMQFMGDREVALTDQQKLVFFIDPSNASLLLTSDKGAASLLKAQNGADVMTITPLAGTHSSEQLFSVDWFGRNGAIAHIADVPRLQGLTISSPDCQHLIGQIDQAPRGTKLDFKKDFTVSTAPVYPPVNWGEKVNFMKPADARAYKLEIGWFPASGDGSMVQGDHALLGFSLPRDHCDSAVMSLNLRPILFGSRPKLDVHVLVNGRQTAIWHFPGPEGKARQEVSAPLMLAPGACDARVELKFDRPGAAPRPYPPNEDQRDLQISVYEMRIREGDDEKR